MKLNYVNAIGVNVLHLNVISHVGCDFYDVYTVLWSAAGDLKSHTAAEVGGTLGAARGVKDVK